MAVKVNRMYRKKPFFPILTTIFQHHMVCGKFLEGKKRFLVQKTYETSFKVCLLPLQLFLGKNKYGTNVFSSFKLSEYKNCQITTVLETIVLFSNISLQILQKMFPKVMRLLLYRQLYAQHKNFPVALSQQEGKLRHVFFI